eukprot:gene16967-18676_t
MFQYNEWDEATLAQAEVSKLGSTGNTQDKLGHSLVIFDWLENNYEYKQDSYLQRFSLYTHYLSFCKENCFVPIIRRKFPFLTTKRLGTRGQSKYHYFGIGIKPSSKYNVKLACGKGLTKFTSSSARVGKDKKKGPLDAILHGFPKVWRTPGKDLSKALVKVELFLVMYKAHCQRILDTVIGANFKDVETFLLHFWHRMPEHVSKFLDIDAISEVVTVCDTILFKKLIDVLIPDSMKTVQESFNSEVTNFTNNFLPWLDICLINAPKKLAAAKMNVAKTYIKLIQRHLSFLQFAKASERILSCDDERTKIIDDLEETDFDEVFGMIKGKQKPQKPSICKTLIDFKDMMILLMKQSSVEAFVAELDNLLYDCTIKPADCSKTDFKQHFSEFILQWSKSTELLMKILTLKNTDCLDSFHQLNAIAMEYMLLVAENGIALEQEKSVWRKIMPYTSVDKAFLCEVVNVVFISENRENVVGPNGQSCNGGHRKRQRKLCQGKSQSKRQKQDTQNPLQLPCEAEMSLSYFDQVVLAHTFESYLESHYPTYSADPQMTYDNCGNYPTNLPDCLYDTSSFRMKNMPSLQDLVVDTAGWNYNDMTQQQDVVQYNPYLRDLGLYYDSCNIYAN